MKAYLVGLAMLLSSSLVFAGPKTAEAKGEKAAPAADAGDSAIVDAEKGVWQAFKDKKADEFKAMFAPGYQGVYNDGIVGVKDEVDALKKSNIKDFEIKETHVSHPTKTSALVTGKVEVDGAMGDKDISGNYYTSSLWVKRGEKWLTILHTEAKEKAKDKM